MTGHALPKGLSADDLELAPAPAAAPAASLGPSGQSADDELAPALQAPAGSGGGGNPAGAQPLSAEQRFGHTHAEHHPLDHLSQVHQSAEAQPDWDGFMQGWQLGLYRDASLAAAFAAVLLGPLGVFVVLRRAVFAAAAVGQAAGLGVVLAFYAAIQLGIGLPPTLGALGCAVLGTALLSLGARSRRFSQDALLGVVFLSASGGAVALGDRITQEAHEVSAILFGTAVVVAGSDVALLAGLSSVGLFSLWLSWRGIAMTGFDQDGARVQGLPVRTLELLLWLLVAVSIAVTTRVLGALPVFAFSVLPALFAIVCTRSLKYTLVVAALLGASCAMAGYVVAYFWGLPVGASQALCCVVALLLALAFKARS